MTIKQLLAEKSTLEARLAKINVALEVLGLTSTKKAASVPTAKGKRKRKPMTAAAKAKMAAAAKKRWAAARAAGKNKL